MRTLILLLLASFVAWGFAISGQEKVVVYLIGDSTCAQKEVTEYPETGWGTPFATYFDATVRVENRAKNGRSTKSFLAEGLWTDVLKTLKSGDYVFIQFGHNNEVPSKVGRYTTPEEFQANLMQYVVETRALGGIPILLTPITRRSFDEAGMLVDTHERYAELVRKVATNEQVPLIDMTARSMALVESLGPSESKSLFNHLEVGIHPNYPDGVADDTHFNELGAREMAQLILQEIRNLDAELAQRIVKPDR